MSEELNAQVAEKIMGWTGITPRAELSGGASLWGNAPTPGGGTIWTRIPAYGYDLNLAAQAEARVIEMGLGDLYAQTLEANIRADLYAADGYWAGWRTALLTASAEARCRAMLAVIGGAQ